MIWRSIVLIGFLLGRLSFPVLCLDLTASFYPVPKEIELVSLHQNPIILFTEVHTYSTSIFTPISAYLRLIGIFSFVILTDGNEGSDFGEPLRFQKVLQGQEVFPFSSSPYAGAEASRNHLSDMRGGYPFRQQIHADARNSLERIAASESFQFRKVLQGQETMPVLSYGRGPQPNQVQEKSATNHVYNGIHVPRNGNCWSIQPQYSASPHLSPSMVRGMSPSSVLLLQQSSLQSLHHSYQNQDSFGAPQRIPKKFAPHEIVASEATHCPLPTQPLFRDNQNFVSMCKDSCRLFGFSLTEGKKADNQACTKPDMHAVRDRLLDIAL